MQLKERRLSWSMRNETLAKPAMGTGANLGLRPQDAWLAGDQDLQYSGKAQ